jgi:hypothetical protein
MVGKKKMTLKSKDFRVIFLCEYEKEGETPLTPKKILSRFYNINKKNEIQLSRFLKKY